MAAKAQIQGHLQDSLMSAAKYFNEGNFERADFICRHLIQDGSRNADVLHLMALIALKRNNLDEAIKWLKEACECRPNDFEFLTNLGNLIKIKGDLIEARKYYEAAIAANKTGVVAFNNLALLLAEQGQLEESISIYKDAIALEPKAAELYFNLSTVYRAKGDKEKSIEACGQALELKPDSFEFNIHLANIYFELEDFEKSLAKFQKASQINDRASIAFNGIGVCQTSLGNYIQAKEAFLKAIGLKPVLPDVQNNLAIVDFALGNFEDAIICLEAALKLRPQYPEALRNYGNILAAQHNYTEAIDFYKKAIEFRKEFFEAYLDLGVAYKNSGEPLLARNSFSDAAKLDWQLSLSICGRMAASLPAFYKSKKEIENLRAEYMSELTSLEECIESNSYRESDIDDILLLAKPTYLSYQGLCDLEIHKRYAKLLQTVMARKFPRWSHSKSKRTLQMNDKIRLGIVSHHFSNHVDWKIIMEGIISHFDREKFEIFAYSTGGRVDEITNQISKKVTKFFRSSSAISICERIEKDHIDILFFPELGIDPTAFKIASLRTAPVQCAAWGRPDTSGLSTIDYFLSPQIMEGDNAQLNYQEKLVLIPDAGFYYEAQKFPVEELTDVSLSRTDVNFLCVQSLFKYMPQYDHVFVEIAKRVPNSQFIFVARPKALANKFLARLSAEFEKAGLEAEKFVKILPRLTPSQYMALCRQGDIFLDSIGFSGCVTVLDAIQENIPIVTVSGDQMRGRQTAGLLRFIGLSNFVASTEDEYVIKAVELAHNIELRKSVGEQLAQNKQKLFGSKFVIKDLEETFQSWFK